MATDPTRILVPQAAKLYLAPVGTPAPNGPTATPDPAWVEVGLFAPDSLQMATTANFQSTASHQSNWPTRRFQTAEEAVIQCNLQEWSTASFKAVFGGGSVTSVAPSGGGAAYAKFTPPAVGGRAEVAAMVEVADGARQVRLVVPRAMQAEGVGLNLNKTNESTLPLRLSVLGSDIAAPWYMITNDTAFGAGGDGGGGGSLDMTVGAAFTGSGTLTAAVASLGTAASAALTGSGTLTATAVAGPSYVRITTTGATFAPTVELASGSAGTVTWTVEETSAVTTGPSPTINYGTAATRHVRMTVTNGGTDLMADVRTFNVGYDHTQDDSPDNLADTYDKPSQNVTVLQSVRAMTGLTGFAAANNAGLNHAIDFSGMSALTNIECFASQITGVTLTGCTSLRRLCLEVNALTALDLNPVVGTLRDLRTAAQSSGTLTFATLTANLSQLWHFCVRDQVVNNMPPASQLPVVQQVWIWNTGQSGTMAFTSSVLNDIRAYQNSYTATSLPNSTGINVIDLHSNRLTQAAVDNLLTTINGFGGSNGLIDITGNAAPSSTGETARTSLVGRGWTVNYTSAAQVGVHSDDFERPDVVGVANLGNGWMTPNGATADIVSGDLVRRENAGYKLLINPGGQDLPADYTVTMSFPAATIGGFLGIVGRWNGSEGITAFFNSSSTDLRLRSASQFGLAEVTLTADNAYPASWSSGTGDHTMAMKMSGTRVDILIDGVLVAHGTSTVNATATGTGYGFSGEGIDRHWHSIGTTVP